MEQSITRSFGDAVQQLSDSVKAREEKLLLTFQLGQAQKRMEELQSRLEAKRTR